MKIEDVRCDYCESYNISVIIHDDNMKFQCNCCGNIFDMTQQEKRINIE